MLVITNYYNLFVLESKTVWAPYLQEVNVHSNEVHKIHLTPPLIFVILLFFIIQ